MNSTKTLAQLLIDQTLTNPNSSWLNTKRNNDPNNLMQLAENTNLKNPRLRILNDDDATEIPEESVLNSVQRSTPGQSSQRGNESNAKGFGGSPNTATQRADANYFIEANSRRNELPISMLQPGFSALDYASLLNSQQYQQQLMANNIMGYPYPNNNQYCVLYLVQNENGISYQPQVYHPGLGLNQFSFPNQLFENGLPQLDAFGGNNGARFSYQNDLTGTAQTAAAEYLNEQYGFRLNQPEILNSPTSSAKQQKLQEDQSHVKIAKHTEKQSPLDANILTEREMQKAVNSERNQAIKVKELNSGTKENIPSGNFAAQVSRRSQGIDANVKSIKEKKLLTCFNKYCQTDRKNPSLWSKTKLNNETVCNLCEDGWNKGQFCHFCHQIYVDNDTYCSDGTEWVECDECKRWTHLACEDKAIQRRSKIAAERNEDFPYSCPKCRDSPCAFGKKKVMIANETQSYLLSQCEDGAANSKDEKAEMLIESSSDKKEQIDKNDAAKSIEKSKAQRKLENIFMKQSLKGKVSFTKSGIRVDDFWVIENLMGQHGKRFKLSENEIREDIQFLRNGKTNQVDANASPVQILTTIQPGFERQTANSNRSTRQRGKIEFESSTNIKIQMDKTQGLSLRSTRNRRI